MSRKAKIRALMIADQERSMIRKMQEDQARRLADLSMIQFVEVEDRLDSGSGSCAVSREPRVTRRDQDQRRMSRDVDVDLTHESFDPDLIMSPAMIKRNARKIIADTERARTNWGIA